MKAAFETRIQLRVLVKPNLGISGAEEGVNIQTRVTENLFNEIIPEKNFHLSGRKWITMYRRHLKPQIDKTSKESLHVVVI
jgi:hypothetical protein